MIPEGVTQIDPNAFDMDNSEMNSALQEVWLPKSLGLLYDAFDCRTGLTTIHYAGTEEDWADVWLYNNPIPSEVNLVYDSPYSY